MGITELLNSVTLIIDGILVVLMVTMLILDDEKKVKKGCVALALLFALNVVALLVH